MRSILTILFLSVLLLSCAGGPATYYAEGDPKTRSFSRILKNPRAATSNYYRVQHNQSGLVLMATEYSASSDLLTKNGYKYDRNGAVVSRTQSTYYHRGPSQKVTEWQYQGGAVKKRVDNWYTRDRSFEKRITTYFDANQRPYLEETQRQGLKLESATEYYYDYYGHLDKSRRDFFTAEGLERDHWITIYDDDERILREEHYLANNTLVAFYRYTYHPAFGYLEREEILDDNRKVFIERHFTSAGLLLHEEQKDREMRSLGWTRYEYDENDNPVWEYIYSPEGELSEKRKYSNPIIREGFRRPR